MDWVQQLTWPNLGNYNSANRQWFVNPDNKQTEMYVKAHDRFKFYWVLGAGHVVSFSMTIPWIIIVGVM